MEDPNTSLELFDVPGSPEGRESVGGGEKVTSSENRLMISKIVCKDFKSYAGVKELGPFHKVCVMSHN